jgi:hypothetical protein
MPASGREGTSTLFTAKTVAIFNKLAGTFLRTGRR